MSVKQTVENVYLRQEAVQKTRKHFWRLLKLFLIVTVCSWLLDTALTAIGDRLTARETQTVVDAMTQYATSESLTSSGPVTDAIMGLVTSPTFWIFNFVYIIITSLVTSGLSLGHRAQLLAVAAWDEKIKARGAFCRMRHCVKAWLLTLWTSLKIGLWAIPGLILIYADVFLWEGAGSDWLAAIGVGLVIGLALPAALRYCLAAFILADEPDRGVRECVTFSKGLMAGRSWQCFKLGVPAILKMLGTVYGMMLLLSVVIVLIGSNVSTVVHVVMLIVILVIIILPMIYFLIQFDLVYALFYLKCRVPAADEPVSYWLRDHKQEAPATAEPVSYWLRDHAEAAPADAEAPVSPDAPAESPADSPEDISPETNEEKENHHE